MVKFWIDDGSDYICVNMLKDEGIDDTYIEILLIEV